ncbi:response regulator transcription factor [Paenibacillus sp. JCM 10914]|uniref:response regulator n=1 Tax=Paenibacillus sp. JCM 10914 TaxID=1236974 RepID=UPI0003CC98C3|nr:response regulator transcription factor [Paenibacillus sp. JCM 10914]GAE07988.1 DNA-binding response regulator, LuxR family [Paenibacillus sp. JCM 10914]
MVVKVLLVDDHLVVLKGLQYFLEVHDEIEIVGQARDGAEALQKIEQLMPDVVLMDIQMPGMDGIEATRQITERYPEVKVIMLTSFSDRDSVIPAIREGAVGYQLKDVEPDVLVDTMIAVMQGNRTFHPEATNQLVLNVRGEREAVNELEQLTAKEKEVLYHITLGESNKEIADRLFISEKTVKTHITSILGKLELPDRTKAAVYALRNKWFES